MGSDPENPDSSENRLQEPHAERADPDPPPVFATWKRAYFFVIGFLILLILLFYIFTVSYT